MSPLDEGTIRCLEYAALKAWPALEQKEYGGWLLRFGRGYTKRANSINPLGEGASTLGEMIACCEARYRQAGLPPIFRVTPLAPAGLDLALAARGYALLDPTAVMTLDLTTWQAPAASIAACRELALTAWFAHYCRIANTPLAVQAAHLEILTSISARRLCALVQSQEQDGASESAACGLGVLDGQLFGLFDLITTPALRRRGYGLALVAGMLAWARSRGARQAYLQVTLGNKAARALYERLGFREAYRYWYRVPPGTPLDPAPCAAATEVL